MLFSPMKRGRRRAKKGIGGSYAVNCVAIMANSEYWSQIWSDMAQKGVMLQVCCPGKSSYNLPFFFFTVFPPFFCLFSTLFIFIRLAPRPLLSHVKFEHVHSSTPLDILYFLLSSFHCSQSLRPLFVFHCYSLSLFTIPLVHRCTPHFTMASSQPPTQQPIP